MLDKPLIIPDYDCLVLTPGRVLSDIQSKLLQEDGGILSGSPAQTPMPLCGGDKLGHRKDPGWFGIRPSNPKTTSVGGSLADAMDECKIERRLSGNLDDYEEDTVLSGKPRHQQAVPGGGDRTQVQAPNLQ